MQNDIAEQVGEYIIEAAKENLEAGKSIVSGESFPALNRAYKKKKLEDGGSGIPDLFMSGDLHDALDYKVVSGGVEIGFWGKEADKADGHLKFSGRENFTPQRRFLPGEDQNFKREIARGIQEIIDENDVTEASDYSTGDD